MDKLAETSGNGPSRKKSKPNTVAGQHNIILHTNVQSYQSTTLLWMVSKLSWVIISPLQSAIRENVLSFYKKSRDIYLWYSLVIVTDRSYYNSLADSRFFWLANQRKQKKENRTRASIVPKSPQTHYTVWEHWTEYGASNHMNVMLELQKSQTKKS